MLSMQFLLWHPHLISILSFYNLQLFRRIFLLSRLDVMGSTYLMILKTVLKTIHVWLFVMNNMIYVIVIFLMLFMMLLKIILREESLVVETSMLLKLLSLC